MPLPRRKVAANGFVLDALYSLCWGHLHIQSIVVVVIVAAPVLCADPEQENSRQECDKQEEFEHYAALLIALITSRATGGQTALPSMCIASLFCSGRM